MWCDDDYPRVLVVGAQPFNRSTNDGITLSNLFHGWPADRLAQVHTVDRARCTDVCTSFYHFGLRNYPVDHGLRRLLGAAGGPVGSALASGGAMPASRGGRSRLMAQVRAVADLTPCRFPDDLGPWLRRHQPDLVYSFLGSVRVNRLAVRIARDLGIPLVPHFMDDWPRTNYGSGELFGLARVSLLRTLRAAVRIAPRGMCISQPMAEEYQRRYGIPFGAFANCVDDAAFAAHPADDAARVPSEAIELVYVGGLHLGRWQTLARLAEVLDRLAGDPPVPRLTIYAPERDLSQFREAFAGRRSVSLDRWLHSDEVPKVLHAADVLVHAESFAPAHRRYTRLSLSTKIPQYLAAGRPILGFGPAELASMRHIVEARAGVVVGMDEPEPLLRALRQLGDADLRSGWGRNGLDHARRHHRREALGRRFAEFLGEAGRSGAGSGRRRSCGEHTGG
ncbi:glycosyl transferase family 1 [Micromonospora sp. NPDC004336]